jgi:hypothetical protein
VKGNKGIIVWAVSFFLIIIGLYPIYYFNVVISNGPATAIVLLFLGGMAASSLLGLGVATNRKLLILLASLPVVAMYAIIAYGWIEPSFIVPLS